MLKKYIISQLTQLSAWLGVGTIFSAIFLPRSFIIFLGVLMILTDDNHLKDKLSKWAPDLTKKIDEL